MCEKELKSLFVFNPKYQQNLVLLVKGSMLRVPASGRREKPL